MEKAVAHRRAEGDEGVLGTAAAVAECAADEAVEQVEHTVVAACTRMVHHGQNPRPKITTAFQSEVV